MVIRSQQVDTLLWIMLDLMVHMSVYMATLFPKNGVDGAVHVLKVASVNFCGMFGLSLGFLVTVSTC